MRIVSLQIHFDTPNYITVLLNEHDQQNDYKDLQVYSKKTLFLDDGRIIPDAIAVQFTKQQLFTGFWETKVDFMFDTIMSEEEYENGYRGSY